MAYDFVRAFFMKLRLVLLTIVHVMSNLCEKLFARQSASENLTMHSLASPQVGCGILICILVDGTASPARAADPLTLFTSHCLSPRLTERAAAEAFTVPGTRHDFYDLRPFADVPPSPPTGRAPTPGTDRRCEVAFDGDRGEAAAENAVRALAAEGITTNTPLPATHADGRRPGTTLLAARKLNPARTAVLHAGTRPGPHGVETFLLIERLTPEASR